MSSNYDVSIEADLIWWPMTQKRQTTTPIECQVYIMHVIYQTLHLWSGDRECPFARGWSFSVQGSGWGLGLVLHTPPSWIRHWRRIWPGDGLVGRPGESVSVGRRRGTDERSSTTDDAAATRTTLEWDDLRTERLTVECVRRRPTTTTVTRLRTSELGKAKGKGRILL